VLPHGAPSRCARPAILTLKAEEAARLEYRRRTKRADADPLRTKWQQAHEMAISFPEAKGRNNWFKQRDEI
jgi:hypothetical protein